MQVGIRGVICLGESKNRIGVEFLVITALAADAAKAVNTLQAACDDGVAIDSCQIRQLPQQLLTRGRL